MMKQKQDIKRYP